MGNKTIGGIMRVSELMHTPAVTCAPDETLKRAAQLMDERNVGCVIVVDQVGEVAGVLTDRDIALRAVSHGLSADIPVQMIMSRDVRTVSPRADVAEAASIMMKSRVRRLPAIDEHGVLHGLIALDDLVRKLGRDTEELTELLVVQAAHLPLSS
jgi:CBS domain-containing protein